MKKIPTLFRRDPDDLRWVLPEVTPGCEWVLAGEGVATRKYDGTCMRLTPDGQWWARREVKPGKQPPPAFVREDHDEVTGKTVGWEPVEQTGWGKYLAEAVASGASLLDPGTYELCGPKVNRNPEGYEKHTLVRHADAEVFYEATGWSSPDVAFTYLNGVVEGLARRGWEGLVWHHPDGRMAKLKAKDFR